jgi:hypothetical protein
MHEVASVVDQICDCRASQEFPQCSPRDAGNQKRGKSLFTALKGFVDSLDSLLCFFLPAATTSNICRRYGRQVHSCNHRDVHRVCERVNGEKGGGPLNLTASQGLESESGKNQEDKKMRSQISSALLRLQLVADNTTACRAASPTRSHLPVIRRCPGPS